MPLINSPVYIEDQRQNLFLINSDLTVETSSLVQNNFVLNKDVPVEASTSRITRSYKKNTVDTVSVFEKIKRLENGPILEPVVEQSKPNRGRPRKNASALCE